MSRAWQRLGDWVLRTRDFSGEILIKRQTAKRPIHYGMVDMLIFLGGFTGNI